MNRRVATAGIGLAVLAVFIGFGGPYLAIADWTPWASWTARVLTMVVLVVVWLGLWWQSRRKNRIANEALLGGISNAPPATDEAADSLNDGFADALRQIRTGSGEAGKLNLYTTPWYAIIGPPGSGKTTALKASGMDFLTGDAHQGVGGTRQCDWWFSHEAVLLDTAGRYFSQDSNETTDRAEWSEFLSLLGKHRPRCPLNGVVIALGVDDLLTATEADLQRHSELLQARLSELTRAFGVQLPVYVWLTKADLLAGFSESFADLSPSGRRQVWGVTGSWEESNASAAVLGELPDGLDDLVDRVLDRLPSRTIEDRSAERRRRIVGFPTQLAALRAPLMQLLTQAFRGTVRPERAALRGVYFTSGTQEGTPLDRVLSGAASSLGIPALRRAEVRENKSYFLGELLTDVVLKESGLVGTNRVLERKLLAARLGAYACALMLVIGLGVGWWWSASNNHNYSDSVAAEARAWQALPKADAVSSERYGRVLTALDQAEVTYQSAAEPVDVGFVGLGLDQRPRLVPAAESAYLRAVDGWLLPLIAVDLQSAMVDRQSQPAELYALLKAYLMLVDPQRADPDFVVPVVDAIQTARGQLDAARRATVGRHLQQALGRTAGAVPNERLIASARSTLSQQPLSAMALGRVLTELRLAFPSGTTLGEAIGLDAHRVFVPNDSLERQLDSAFSAAAFEALHGALGLEALTSFIADGWVMERSDWSSVGIPGLRAEVNADYEAAYARYWFGLLNELSLVDGQPRQRQALMDQLLRLSQTPSALQGLLQLIATQTDLTVASSALDQVSDRLAQEQARVSAVFGTPDGSSGGDPGSAVRNQFAAIRQLGTDSTALRGVLSAAYTELLQGGSIAAVRSRLQQLAVTTPEPLARWFTTLSGGAEGIARQDAVSGLVSRWQSTALPLCERALAGRYPIDPSALLEIPLADFASYFGPGGHIDRFIVEGLAGLVVRQGDRLSWTPAASGLVSSDLRQHLTQALSVQRRFFNEGALGFSMAVSADYLSDRLEDVRWRVGDQTIVYRHGPASEWKVAWPGDVAGSSVAFTPLNGLGTNAEQTGSWGLFRLLNAATRTPLGESELLIAWVSTTGAARFRVRVDSVNHPLIEAGLAGLRCPAG